MHIGQRVTITEEGNPYIGLSGLIVRDRDPYWHVHLDHERGVVIARKECVVPDRGDSPEYQAAMKVAADAIDSCAAFGNALLKRNPDGTFEVVDIKKWRVVEAGTFPNPAHLAAALAKLDLLMMAPDGVVDKHRVRARNIYAELTEAEHRALWIARRGE